MGIWIMIQVQHVHVGLYLLFYPIILSTRNWKKSCILSPQILEIIWIGHLFWDINSRAKRLAYRHENEKKTMDIWYIIYNFHEHINYNCAPVHPCAVTLNKWIHFQKSCKSMKSSANLGSQTSLSVRDGVTATKDFNPIPGFLQHFHRCGKHHTLATKMAWGSLQLTCVLQCECLFMYPVPRNQTLPIGSRESFTWILKTILCLVLDVLGVYKERKKPGAQKHCPGRTATDLKESTKLKTHRHVCLFELWPTMRPGNWRQAIRWCH